MKRFLFSFVCALTLVFACSSLSFGQTFKKEVDGYKMKFRVNSKKKSTVTLIKASKKAKELNIPATVEHKKKSFTVTEIGRGHTPVCKTPVGYQFGNTLVFSYGLVGVGNYYLSRNKNLTEVTIPSTVNTIHNLAFADCPNLTTVNLPSDIANVSKSAFKRSYYQKEKDGTLDVPKERRGAFELYWRYVEKGAMINFGFSFMDYFHIFVSPYFINVGKSNEINGGHFGAGLRYRHHIDDHLWVEGKVGAGWYFTASKVPEVKYDSQGFPIENSTNTVRKEDNRCGILLEPRIGYDLKVNDVPVGIFIGYKWDAPDAEFKNAGGVAVGLSVSL